MRINNNGSVGRLTSGGKTHKSQGTQGKFQPGQTKQAARGTQPAAAQSIRGIDALLAIQEVGTPTSGKRKRAVRRGNSMLDVLEEIRADLLAGGLSGPKLQKLLQLVREQTLSTGDGDLDSVLGEIDLRARVELAKRGLSEQ